MPQATENVLPDHAAMPEDGRKAVIPGWVVRDSPYIAMLVLIMVGVVFRSTLFYWVVITPLFATISIVAGWRHVRAQEGHLSMAGTLVLCWLGLLVAIVVMFDGGFAGTATPNAKSLVMMTLLALGTFNAGVQARVWRFCAVGAILFAAVPALGWLDQSPLFMIAGIVTVIAVGALAWWIDRRAVGRAA